VVARNRWHSKGKALAVAFQRFAFIYLCVCIYSLFACDLDRGGENKPQAARCKLHFALRLHRPRTALFCFVACGQSMEIMAMHMGLEPRGWVGDDDDSLIACDPIGSWRYYMGW